MVRPHPTPREWALSALRRRALAVALVVGSLAAILASWGGVAPVARAADGGVGWPMYQGGLDRSGYNGAETSITQATAAELKLQWSLTAKGSISAQVIAANGMLYWGTWNGLEHGTSLSGKTVWTQNLGTTSDSNCAPSKVGVASTAAEATINGTPTIFVGGGNATFYALNATTGAILWHTALGAPPSHFLWSSPLVYNGSVYEGVASFGDCPLVRGSLVRMDAATGSIQDIFYTMPKGCIGAGVWGSPTVDVATGMVYFGTANASTCSRTPAYAEAVVALRASDLSLVSVWPASPSPDDFGSTPVLFSATINGQSRSLLGIVNKNGRFYALDRTNLSAGPVWSVIFENLHAAGYVPAAFDGSQLYEAGGATTINGKRCAGSVQAMDPASGAFNWQVCLPAKVQGAVIAVPGLVVVNAGNAIYVIGATGAMAGKALFIFHSGSSAPFSGPASIADGVLYAGSMGGVLYALGT